MLGIPGVFQSGGDAWTKWNEAMQKTLLSSQVAAGDMGGSWNPIGPNAETWGRVGQTALRIGRLVLRDAGVDVPDLRPWCAEFSERYLVLLFPSSLHNVLREAAEIRGDGRVVVEIGAIRLIVGADLLERVGLPSNLPTVPPSNT